MANTSDSHHINFYDHGKPVRIIEKTSDRYKRYSVRGNRYNIPVLSGHYNMDRGAYAGVLLLISLSVNNSIVLVDYLSKNFRNGSLKKLYQLSANRLRPIFTTTVTTVAALIPLLISAESSFWKSLSLSVVGGIILSSIIVVLLVPMLYYQISARR